MKAQSFPKPNKKLLISLGKEISGRRKAKRLTVEEFAELCDLHSKYIQTIEAGKRNISITVFLRLSNALRISPLKLLKSVLSNG
ncbi:MAG: helix-turn-helix transcriptional regulator [bacterium]